jgi:cytochrome c biogenesis protein CcdA
MDNTIEILLSKRKIFFLSIASLCFVLIGLLAVLKPEKLVSFLFRNTDIIRVIGILGICFFGIALVFIVIKLLDKKPGLIINQYGITDNTNSNSFGLIEWNDIVSIENKQVMSTKFLLLHTNKPEKYISRVNNFILKRTVKMNFKTYGTTI